MKSKSNNKNLLIFAVVALIAYLLFSNFFDSRNITPSDEDYQCFYDEDFETFICANVYEVSKIRAFFQRVGLFAISLPSSNYGPSERVEGTLLISAGAYDTITSASMYLRTRSGSPRMSHDMTSLVKRIANPYTSFNVDFYFYTPKDAGDYVFGYNVGGTRDGRAISIARASVNIFVEKTTCPDNYYTSWSTVSSPSSSNARWSTRTYYSFGPAPGCKQLTPQTESRTICNSGYHIKGKATTRTTDSGFRDCVPIQTASCPNNYYSAWEVKKSDSTGTWSMRAYYSYGPPPNCETLVPIPEYKTECKSGYHIEGKDTTKTTDSGWPACVPIQTASAECVVCRGNTAVTVPITEGRATKPRTGLLGWLQSLFNLGSRANYVPGTQQMCEVLFDEYGNTMHTRELAPYCINSEPIANPEFLKPEVKAIFIKDGNKWVELNKNTQIPESITKNWKSGTEVDVIVEFSNAGAKNYDTNSISEENRVTLSNTVAWLNNMFEDVTSFVDVVIPGTSKAAKVIHMRTDPRRNDVLGEANMARINAAPFVNLAIAEIGFYGVEASTQAYAYSRFAGGTTGEQTVRRINSCQGDEHLGGWIEQYMLLVTSPINNNCWSYDDSSTFRKIFGQDMGGACNIKIQARIKIPEPGDAIASGVSNFDPDGKYYLHAAMFDRCWRPDAPPTIVSELPKIRVQLKGDVVTEGVCCKIPGGFLGLFPDYRGISEAQCDSLGGKPVSDIAKCSADATREMCYVCDMETASVKGVEVFKGDCGDENALGALRGWTLNYDEAYAACEALKPNVETRKCVSCLGYVANTPVDKNCPLGYYEENIVDNVCVDSCGGNCSSDEYCYYGECLSIDEQGNMCSENNNGQGCFDNQECLLQDNVWVCRTKEPITSKVECFVCDASKPNKYKSIGMKNFLGSETQTCVAHGAFTKKVAETKCVIDSEGFRAFINPDNSDEWCVETSSSTKCYPRKDLIPMSELSTLDKESVIKNKFTTFQQIGLGTAMGIPGVNLLAVGLLLSNDANMEKYLEDVNNPVCVNVFGDVQCADEGECLPAKKSSRPMYKDNNKVYEAIKPMVVFKQSHIEEFGVCVPEQRDAWNSVKNWVADLFGLDADSPVVVGIIVLALIIILVVINKLLNPRR